jgi:quercetin dioxygenase-like cupin family protein
MALNHVTSGEVVDLRSGTDRPEARGTRALVKSDSFEAIRLVVPAGGEIPPHQVAGKFTLQCLEGKVRVGVPDGSVELAAGQWVYFDGGVRHSVSAVEDSSLLLTIIFAATREAG